MQTWLSAYLKEAQTQDNRVTNKWEWQSDSNLLRLLTTSCCEHNSRRVLIGSLIFMK